MCLFDCGCCEIIIWIVRPRRNKRQVRFDKYKSVRLYRP